MTSKFFSLWLAVLCVLWLASPAYLSTHDFYNGKTITIIKGSEAGGATDMRTKVMLPFLRKYIPGNPTIMVEYMPGGGGRKGANYIYRTTRPDGLTIGAPGSSFVPLAVLGEPGVQYDLEKFIYLGSSTSLNRAVFLTRSELGLTNLEKLRGALGIRVGAQSVGHDVYIKGRLFAWLLDLKQPKFVVGYASPELNLALRRGEVDARSGHPETLLAQDPQFFDKGLTHFHATLDIPKGNKHPRLASLPDLDNFAKNDRDEKLLALFRAFRIAGHPFLLPPRVPEERVEILREAMRNIFRDPEFHREFKKLTTEDSTPLFPEEHEKVMKGIPKHPEVIELFKTLAGAGPLPSR